MNIKNIINEVIEEYFDGIEYENIKNKKKSMTVVYQLAFSDRLPGIFKNGFSREFAATAGGNFYCTALYTTYDLDSTIENSKTKSDLYGDAIVKIGINSYDRFFICNKEIAQKVYKDKWRLKDQLEYLLKGRPDIYNKIVNSWHYNDIINGNKYRTSSNVISFLEALDGMYCKSDKILNDLDIRGFVFVGGHDGNVAIIRDFKGLIPLEYSLDHGKTWKTDLFSKKTIDNTAKDHDPIIFLGKEATNFIKPKSYRFINGYMRVQREIDGKYNFIDSNHNYISNIWYDKASNIDDNGKALVKYQDENFYIDKNGFYLDINGTEPDMTFSEAELEFK